MRKFSWVRREASVSRQVPTPVVAAGSYEGLWLYWVAPCLAAWLATVAPWPASPHAGDEEPPQYPDEWILM